MLTSSTAPQRLHFVTIVAYSRFIAAVVVQVNESRRAEKRELYKSMRVAG